MDLVLLHEHLLLFQVGQVSFNPYFNGSSTSTSTIISQITSLPKVSILILMDLVLLQVLNITDNNNNLLRFNPYFNGSSTSTYTFCTTLTTQI